MYIISRPVVVDYIVWKDVEFELSKFESLIDFLLTEYMYFHSDNMLEYHDISGYYPEIDVVDMLLNFGIIKKDERRFYRVAGTILQLHHDILEVKVAYSAGGAELD